MKFRLVASLVAVIIATVQSTFAQGTFFNLDFEFAVVPPGTPPGTILPASDALPGWTCYIGGNQVSGIGYDSVNINDAGIWIYDANSPFVNVVLQGNYTVGLQPNNPIATIFPAIAQVGTIPSGTRSLEFYAQGPVEVLFGSQQLGLVTLATTPTYKIFAADVTALAGQTGELRFTNGGLLDNITFSSEAIPEPRVTALAVLGLVLLSLRLTEWFNKSMKANRRCSFALVASREFGRIVHATRLFSAAVAYFCRSPMRLHRSTIALALVWISSAYVSGGTISEADLVGTWRVDPSTYVVLPNGGNSSGVMRIVRKDRTEIIWHNGTVVATLPESMPPNFLAFALTLKENGSFIATNVPAGFFFDDAVSEGRGAWRLGTLMTGVPLHPLTNEPYLFMRFTQPSLSRWQTDLYWFLKSPSSPRQRFLHLDVGKHRQVCLTNEYAFQLPGAPGDAPERRHKGEPDAAANRSQPLGLETNRASAAAGFARCLCVRH